jgi:hypothetical protein
MRWLLVIKWEYQPRIVTDGMRAMIVSISGVAGFVHVGYLLSLVSFPLFVRIGITSVVVVVTLQVVLAVLIRAIPELIRGLRSLRQGCGWQEWNWALLFIGAATLRFAISTERSPSL